MERKMFFLSISERKVISAKPKLRNYLDSSSFVWSFLGLSEIICNKAMKRTMPRKTEGIEFELHP